MTKKSVLMLTALVGIVLPLGAMAVGGDDDKGKEKAAGGKSELQAAIGKPAPDFTLRDAEGKEHKLSQYKGKIVVLQWTNHTCPFIKYHEGKAKTMQATCKGFEGKSVVWLAIDSSRDCEEKIEGIRGWIKENEISFPILLDAAGSVGRAYDAKSTPHMFVIDREGILQYRGAIDDDPGLGGEASRNYVKDAVNALLKGSAVSQKETKSYGCSVKYKKS